MRTEATFKLLIKEEPLLLFVIPGCPWCKKAKELLKPYHFRLVILKPEERPLLNKLSGMRTVPQIFSHGRLLGGYTDVYELIEKHSKI
jgi:glutaredoxin